MYQLLSIQSPSQLEPYQSLKGLTPLTVSTFQSEAPDAHWLLLQAEELVAHCSLWWRHVPQPGLGLIGHYGAKDVNAAQQLLTIACEQLAQQGCHRAIAPINGSTWQSYRFITQRSSEPSFFLELNHPDRYPQDFQDHGFLPCANYSSALNGDLSQPEPKVAKVAERMKEIGVQIRSFEMQQFEQELHRIYELSVISFRQNFLYTPIDEQSFLTQYHQVQPYLQPEIVLMAEHEERLVGFLFAIPDWLQAQRGEQVDTIVIKTVAVLPGKRYGGLGNLLAVNVQTIAYALGYCRAIHALMHDANHSRNISDRYAQTIRRYTLFSKDLSKDLVKISKYLHPISLNP